MKRLLLALVASYQRWGSPLLHASGAGGCGFEPTCSEYARQAIELHGAARGSLLALWRILRCNPLNRHGGFDPVPPSVTKARK